VPLLYDRSAIALHSLPDHFVIALQVACNRSTIAFGSLSSGLTIAF
jgi:hypothetical protein